MSQDSTESALDNVEFSTFIRTNFDALARYVHRRTFDSPGVDSDNVIGDVVAIAWRRRRDIPANAELPWLLAVARKVLANAYRRDRRSRTRTSHVVHQPSAESEVIAHRAVLDALGTLDRHGRELLMAVTWDGLSLTQLSELYGVSENAVAVRLSRAKSQFQRAYAGQATVGPSPRT